MYSYALPIDHFFLLFLKSLPKLQPKPSLEL